MTVKNLWLNTTKHAVEKQALFLYFVQEVQLLDRQNVTHVTTLVSFIFSIVDMLIFLSLFSFVRRFLVP